MDTPLTLAVHLATERLKLRPFALSDAKRVQELAGDVEIARTTLHVPHPYPDGGAEAWITRLNQAGLEGKQYTFAITTASDGVLIGSIGIGVQHEHARGELGYWIGRAYWGQGYGTEAARTVLDFAFDTLQLHRVYAYAMTSNPGSTRIMEKIGMKFEGVLRQHVLKWGEFFDLAAYGVVKSDLPSKGDPM
ncbi:GNAT family N-acetyltransferase [Alicyclobacillus curvatus]|jgi:[ribosomal protein S5]-alanine N-acetyltransferase|nr:GNAT family N-acetyltransferase [Alicyclobacillus curvatus]